MASPLTPIALGAATLLAAAVLLLGCVCCRQQKTGFQVRDTSNLSSPSSYEPPEQGLRRNDITTTGSPTYLCRFV